MPWPSQWWARASPCFHCSSQNLWHHPWLSPFRSQSIPSPPQTLLFLPSQRSPTGVFHLFCPLPEQGSAPQVSPHLSPILPPGLSSKCHLTRKPFPVHPKQHNTLMFYFIFPLSTKFSLGMCIHFLTRTVSLSPTPARAGQHGGHEVVRQPLRRTCPGEPSWLTASCCYAFRVTTARISGHESLRLLPAMLARKGYQALSAQSPKAWPRLSPNCPGPAPPIAPCTGWHPLRVTPAWKSGDPS